MKTKTENTYIPDDWTIKKLKDISKIVSGGTPDKSSKLYWENGDIPWATPTDITSNNNKYISKTSLYITATGLKESSANLLPSGSILMTSRATIGARCINLVPMATNQGFKSFVCNEELNNEYLYYYIDTLKPDLFKLAGGSTFLEISKNDVENIKILLPKIIEQKKIASIISTIDDLIENTDHLINSYTLLKKGLMQTLLTKGIGHIRFKQTSIGEIPVEWEVKRLDDIFSITAGRDLVKEAFSPIKDNKHPFPIYSNSIENKGLYGYAKVARHKENSITITARGTIGRANTRTEKFDAIGRLLIMEPTEDLVCFFISEYVNHKVKFSIESTGVPQLTVPQASQYFVAFPPVKEQQKIASILSIIDNYLSIYVGKKENLNLLKKGLMQQLLTGKIRVKV
jgi:type I restriction enzyme, S subunit